MQNARGKQIGGITIFNSLFDGIQCHFCMFYIACTDMLAKKQQKTSSKVSFRLSEKYKFVQN